MNKALFVFSLLAIATAIFASPQNPPPSQQQHVSAQSAPASHHSYDDRHCIRDTGSLLAPKEGGCTPVAGRAYTRKDIDRTGEQAVGAALEKLDPTITVRSSH